MGHNCLSLFDQQRLIDGQTVMDPLILQLTVTIAIGFFNRLLNPVEYGVGVQEEHSGDYRQSATALLSHLADAGQFSGIYRPCRAAMHASIETLLKTIIHHRPPCQA